MPLTNGQNRESFIFTYAGPLPVAANRKSKAAGRRRQSRWPVGSYGGGPTEPSGYNRNFLECGKEIDALGYCDGNPLYRQLLGLELTHPVAAPASTASSAESDQALDDLVELVGAVDGLMQQQAGLDVDNFAEYLGRSFAPGEERDLYDGILRAKRWTFIESGITHPRFLDLLEEVTTDVQRTCVDAALARYLPATA